MIDESLKAWRRQPSDKEWHEIFHGKPEDLDLRCYFCRRGPVDENGYRKRDGRALVTDDTPLPPPRFSK